jgi:3-hydroxyisobutyrate dehydrogenase-like beta-hydroxyacid dehydrogenase
VTDTVTLLGVGKMGAAFVERWRSAGREVVLWNRTASAAQALEGDGVRVASSARAAAEGSNFVVTMLTNGDALRSVVIEGGVLDAMSPGATLIDLSTIDAPSSATVAVQTALRGVLYVRGGVSGTPAVVRAGGAGLLLSGPAQALAAAQRVLDEITPHQSVVGDAEESRIVKIAVNSMLGGTMQLLAEATAIAEANGVDRSIFLDALDTTVMSSRFVSYKGAALRTRDYRATFTTADLKKDMELANATADAHGVKLVLGRVVLEQLVKAVDAGYATQDFLSLFCVEQSESGMAVDVEGSAIT